MKDKQQDTMNDKLDMSSPDLVNENLERLAALFPNCVTETENGREVDFDLLRQELSHAVVEGNKERYRLEWPGKREAIVTANLPTTNTLRPVREDSVNFDTTENLYIEGDNLEVLKLLQESYLGKIKMIYIDPPYNTGKDFVYKDNFSEDKLEHELESGQRDDYGKRLVPNPETSGRYHSDWLSMMYPRLKLARNLLTDDGVIFISIGVEEISNLIKLLNEIFGELNFIEIFSWVKTSTPPALSTKSRKTNEYIVCYEKSWNPVKYRGELLDGGDQPLLNSGNSEKVLNFPKDKVLFNPKKFSDGPMKKQKPARVELLDDIVIKHGYALNDFRLKGEFKWTQEFLDQEIKNGTTFIIKSEQLSIRFIRDEDGYKRPTNLIKEQYYTPIINKKKNGVGTNENASSELIDLMGLEVFSYPKPVSLIKYIMNFIVEEGDIVLDFFSGSATTAESSMSFSCQYAKAVKYIMVQLPEDLDENLRRASDGNVRRILENGIRFLDSLSKPHLLTELAKERIRRASQKILKEQKHLESNRKADKTGELDFGDDETIVNRSETLDVGFRVYRLDSSNMQDVYYRPQDYSQKALDLFEDNVKSDRSPDDLLAQVMLDWGLPLSLKIEQADVLGKRLFKVAANSLFACFNEGIDEDFAREIAKEKPLRIVFRDRSFKDDTAKENVKQLLKQLSPETEMRVI